MMIDVYLLADIVCDEGSPIFSPIFCVQVNRVTDAIEAIEILLRASVAQDVDWQDTIWALRADMNGVEPWDREWSGTLYKVLQRRLKHFWMRPDPSDVGRWIDCTKRAKGAVAWWVLDLSDRTVYPIVPRETVSTMEGVIGQPQERPDLQLKEE